MYDKLSSLERSVVDEGLATFGLRPEKSPQGKVVRNIYVMTASPFSEESSVLRLLNAVHINTRDHIIRRDLFFKEGDAFDKSSIRDSELLLRSYTLLRSLAVIVLVQPKKKSKIDNEVDILVATKDVISLRPSFSFKGTAKKLNNLLIAVGEHNILGLNKSLAAIYELQEAVHIGSLRYFDPRLFGSRWQLLIKPSILFSRASGAYDGFLGELKVEKPLLSEADKWGYGLTTSLGSKPIIDFSADKIRTYDVPETPDVVEKIERKYRWRFGSGRVYGRRSFGRLHKKEIFFGYNFLLKRPTTFAGASLTEQERTAFERDVLPKSEFESFLDVGFAYFQNRYLSLYDYETFKAQETYRAGPMLTVSNDFASKAVLFSDHYFLRPKLSLAYLHKFGHDSYGALSASSSSRYDGEFTNNIFKTGLSVVSKKLFGIGRIILDARYSISIKNRDNQNFFLGTNSGLRGVESRAYKGPTAFRTNLELRSAPLDIWIFHAGLVLFYDLGAAFKEWSKADPTHTVGFGLRILAPQISAQLFRIDFGFPIYGKGQRENVWVPSFGIGQAF